MRRVRTRPPLKQARILNHLRARIISGKLAPGARLPNRWDLEAQFKVSTVTMQRAIDRLIEEGFLVARAGIGTHVAERPPHLNRYALVYPSTEQELGKSKLWMGIGNCAAQVARRRGKVIDIFHDVEFHRGESYHRLMRQVETHCLAGIIFAMSPQDVGNTPLIQEATLPMAAIMAGTSFPGIDAVWVDWWSFIEHALDRLKANGRKRVAVLSPNGWIDQATRERMLRAVADRGMKSRPFWWQGMSPLDAEPAANLVHLLLSNPADRPDALIIGDDHLVESATRGIVAAGIKAPDQIEVVAHVNFPLPPPSVVPVTRLGFDIESLVEGCLDAIDRRHLKGAPPTVSLVPARFE